MRHDLTPPGLHYVLTHYDIPYVPEDTPGSLGSEAGSAARSP